jgi:uncharacterized repeat protein (TIGR03806 family)
VAADGGGEITGLGSFDPAGASASDGLTLTLSRGGNLNEQRFEGKLNGVGAQDGTGFYRMVDTGLATTANTQYHYIMTFENGVGSFGATGGRLSWYRNGVLAASADLGFPLNQIEDVNNWLGRSLWTNDRNANAAFNEARIYNHAFTPAEVVASQALGPNPALPTAAADTVTMHHGQKVGIAVLTNDTSAMAPVIVQAPLHGTALVQSNGRILYAHTSGTPVLDSFTYRAINAAGQSSPVTVTVNFSNSLRIPNANLNVPLTPPPVSIQAIEAFPGLTFSGPTCMAYPPGETQRLFVCTKGGTIFVIPNVTASTATASTVLTLSGNAGGLFNGDVPAESLSTASEQGLLGLAFHPNYASNGYIYIFYSVSMGGVVYERVSRITLNNPTSSTPTAILNSERVLIQQVDDYNNHNGGDLHFGPDGYLYISLGDEGSQDDQGLNSQRIDKDFFSGILRIDVDLEGDEITGGNPSAPDDANLPPNSHAAVILYGGKAAFEVPADNPYVGATSFNGIAIQPTAVRTEFWAVGLRNPWRFSFDGNELWCGDVGGGAREEINLITRGGNYGWVYREGEIAGPFTTYARPAPPTNFTSTAIEPLHRYSHGSGTNQGDSVTGGFVYRGTRVPSLTGSYIFADYVSGNVWSLVRNGTTTPTVTRIFGETGIAAFKPDPSNGDVLIADYGGNRLLRIASVTNTTTYPTTLSATGIFADLTDLSPNPGILPYKVNLPFWSDHAEKRRWFTMPGTSSTMTWSRDGSWTHPTGQIWIKHFDLPLARSNPPQAGDPTSPSKRIETRLLVKNASGSYGVSYRWNDAGTEATLVSDSGDTFDIGLTVNGAPYTQRWIIPSRAQCTACHTPQGGHSLSMNTRQLNLTHSINGFAGNQLDLLKNSGYFSNIPESPNLLPFHMAHDNASFPVEARVRSYLAVNCAYCHKPGGTATPSAWDGRHEVSLEQTGLINGIATNNGGSTLNKLIVPADTNRSVIYNRVAVSNGFTRMPSLGSNELDLKNIALLSEWIGQSLPAKKTYQQWRQQAFGSSVSAQGEPGYDADGDGQTNQEEFLAATNPLSGTSYFTATPGWNGDQFKLEFNAPLNQSIRAEISPNLRDWTLWDVPGNHGLPRPGGAVTLQGPVSESNHFFRLKLNDN